MNRIKIIVVWLSLGYFLPLHANVHSYFQHIHNNPQKLDTFLRHMPKGGELHYHLAGGPSPEYMLALVAKKQYCIAADSLSISKGSETCTGISTQTLSPASTVFNRIIKSWSLEQFVAGKESAHDHFFNTFPKFMPLVIDFKPYLIANVLQRAAQQNELYLEILDMADDARSLQFSTLITNVPTLSEKKKTLLANKAFQENIDLTVFTAEHLEKQTKQILGCSNQPNNKGCKIEARFLYYVLREQPLDSFFAQALNAFAAVARSPKALVGVNLVQAEDAPLSLQEYNKQMQIFNYLHAQYPNVHISLHAGELTPALVTRDELKDHIYNALFIGHAQRIGHGTDIIFEQQAKKTLTYMQQQQIAVEINLISNQKILNLNPQQIPFQVYLEHHVPITLSTDDEGILRTDLTEQYVNAAQEYHLDYATLKNINRNALTYAFLPGKSIWSDAPGARLIAACRNLNSTQCQTFIAQSPKAQLQWQLEQQLATFEQQFN